MSDRSRTKYTILGMLSFDAMTGYEIAKTIQASTNHFWSESEGQIYPALTLCLKEGLATCKETFSKKTKRTKKIYSITAKGKKLLNEWLKKPVQSTLVRNELLLKLFFGKNSDKKDSVHHITTHQKQIEQELQTYQVIRDNLMKEHTKSPHLKFWLMTLNFGLKEAKAHLAWCKETLQQLDSE